MNLLMFPGQGSQHPEMGKVWYQNFKEAQLVFEEASDATKLDLKKICFEGTDSDLRATEITQPALLTTCLAIFRSVCNNSSLFENNCVFAGHSLGEYSALVACGAIPLDQAAWTVHQRGKFMQQAVPAGEGAMLALIFRGKDNIRQRCQQLCEAAKEASNSNLWIANENSLEQIVLSGEQEAAKWAEENAKAAPTEARRAIALNVSAPFHCPLMKAAADQLKVELDKLIVSDSSNQYIANVDGCAHAIKSDEVKHRLFEQVTASVKWVDSIQCAKKLNVKNCIEIGPGTVLSGLCKKIDSDLSTQNIQNPEDFSS